MLEIDIDWTWIVLVQMLKVNLLTIFPYFPWDHSFTILKQHLSSIELLAYVASLSSYVYREITDVSMCEYATGYIVELLHLFLFRREKFQRVEERQLDVLLERIRMISILNEIKIIDNSFKIYWNQSNWSTYGHHCIFEWLNQGKYFEVLPSHAVSQALML